MKEYHILSLSGGKDSTALAFFMKENMAEIFEKTELVFCDTECELPETYDYLNKIEIFLGKKISRIKPFTSFEHLIQLHNFLPTPHRRWCTVELKTKPFKKFVYDKISNDKNTIIKLYIGIRSDEIQRASFGKYDDSIIQENYPFVDYNIFHNDVLKILDNAGIGLPEYYKWTSRSGCYFCFFKSKLSWLLLNEYHPDLYQKAIDMEQPRISEGGFGWNINYTLKDMIKPENAKKIKEKYNILFEKKNSKKKILDKNFIMNIIEQADNCETGTCYMCHL